MKKIIYALAVTSLCGSLAVAADEKPTPAEARKVINYYFNGKGQGAIPMDYKLCKEISQQGEMKNECVAEIADKKVAKGEDAYLWMNFLVPAGEESRILVQYSRKDKVRNTSNISLGSATRFRTWKKIPTGTAGEWKINMIQELENGDVDIGQMKFSVLDASQ
jgi:hypothetical protein